MDVFKRKHDEVFVIGNGPSLNETPLDKIQEAGYDTFAMNRIHLLYPFTAWRPDFYFMIDMNMQNTPGYWRRCILQNMETPKYLWEDFRDKVDGGIGDIQNTIWMPRCQKHHYYMANNTEKRVKEWHFPEVCTGIGGMSAMLQIAAQMEYKKIYLVGCDLGYQADGKVNHFNKEYTQDGRDRADIDNNGMTYLHEMAKSCSPVPIYNATIGGELEVYDRVDLNELL